VLSANSSSGRCCTSVTMHQLCTAGRQLGLSVPDAISAAQGAGAAAKAGNCPQAVIALNLAQSSPDAMSSARLQHAVDGDWQMPPSAVIELGYDEHYALSIAYVLGPPFHPGVCGGSVVEYFFSAWFVCRLCAGGSDHQSAGCAERKELRGGQPTAGHHQQSGGKWAPSDAGWAVLLLLRI
jgi:hypothetical protein